MQVPTIKMDSTAAQQMVDLYREEIRLANETNPRRATAIDRLLLRGYRKLAAGHRLIDIVEVMRAMTAYDEHCRPRLAFARATATSCEFRRPYSGTEGDGQFLDLPRAKGKRALHKFGPGTFRTWRQLERAQEPRGYRSVSKARVPPVPLYLRPTDSLANYFILFEAEWEPIPPRDPMLLKQLDDSSTLFVVVAEWNLTDLERGVLQGLMRNEH